MTTNPDDTFESEVRAMLRQRADDIALDDAGEMPLAVTATTFNTSVHGFRRARMMVLAAACLLIVTCLGAVVATAGGSGDAQTVKAEQSATTELPEAEDSGTDETEPTSTTEATEAVEPTATTEAPAPDEAPDATEPEASPSDDSAPANAGQPEPPAPPASAPPAPPAQVSFNEMNSGNPHRWLVRNCEGATRLENVSGILVITRLGPPEQPLDVALRVTGALASHVSFTPLNAAGPVTRSSATIPAGQHVLELNLWLEDDAPAGSFTITAQPGEGYTLTDRTAHTFTFPKAEINQEDCLRPVPATPATQTITVGQRPQDVVFSPRTAINTQPVIEGALPPGLRLTAPANTPPHMMTDTIRWGGAATTPGTYKVTVRHCSVNYTGSHRNCDGTSVLTIVVQP